MSGLPVLLFLDISGGELLVIMLVVFLVFGPEKMPEMARKAGRFMNQMKKASNDLTREFKKETSSLQSEFNNVQSKVKDEVESVSREINRTKAQVVSDLKIETNPPPPDKENSSPETTVNSQQVSDLVKPADNTVTKE
jgi:sec-independent protein translocase protein TatA